MQIAVITVQREPMYLWGTLRALLETTPDSGSLDPDNADIDVFIGHRRQDPTEDQLLLRLQNLGRVRGRRLPRDLWDLIEPLPPKLRAVGNFIAALHGGCDCAARHPIGTSGVASPRDCAEPASHGDLMLFEDDVVIKPGWLDAIKAIRAVDPKLGTFISLYSHQDLRGMPGRVTSTSHLGAIYEAVEIKTPIVDFYGTLGLFVPSKHRAALTAAALIHLQPTDPRPPESRWPFDEIVKMYINDHHECQLAVTIPSYVDHVGEVSLINPTHGPRRAPMF
jgi:hypothetical protein